MMDQAMKTGFITLRLLGIMAAVALTSCAEGNYPSLGNITKVNDSSILNPQQRADALRELEKEREAQNDRAAKKD